MEDILEDIANLTKGAQEKVNYMKDQATQAQKTSQGKEAILPFSQTVLQFVICAPWFKRILLIYRSLHKEVKQYVG